MGGDEIHLSPGRKRHNEKIREWLSDVIVFDRFSEPKSHPLWSAKTITVQLEACTSST